MLLLALLTFHVFVLRLYIYFSLLVPRQCPLLFPCCSLWQLHSHRACLLCFSCVYFCIPEYYMSPKVRTLTQRATRNGRLCNHSLFVSTAQPEALQDSSFNKTFFWSQDDLRCRSQEPIQTTPLVRQLTQKVKIPATPTSLKPHARGTQKRRCHLAPLHTPNHIRRLFCQGLLVHPTQSTRHCTFSVVLMCTLSSSSPHLDVRNWHEFPETFLASISISKQTSAFLSNQAQNPSCIGITQKR